jgi:hypothetical protein
MRMNTVDSPSATVEDALRGIFAGLDKVLAQVSTADAARIKTAVAKFYCGESGTDSRVKDVLLTTSARLTAEPAPKPGAGDFGVRQTGKAGQTPTQVDVDAAWSGIEAHIRKAEGLLSPSDIAKLRASMAKYAGAEGGRTNAAGITSTDSMTAPPRDLLAKMNADSKSFWSDKFVETDRAIYGR